MKQLLTLPLVFGLVFAQEKKEEPKEEQLKESAGQCLVLSIMRDALFEFLLEQRLFPPQPNTQKFVFDHVLHKHHSPQFVSTVSKALVVFS